MAKGKKRPVLYEVFNRSRRARGHGVLGRGAPPAPAPAAEPKPIVRPVPPPVAPPPMLRPGPRPPRAAEEGGDPIVRIVDGRVHLVLSWAYVAALGVLVVAVAWALFYAGQRSATPLRTEGPTGDELLDQSQFVPAEVTPSELAPTHRPEETVVATPVSPSGESPRPTPQTPPRQPPAPRVEPARPAFEFQAGYHYVRVQYFRSSRLADAEAAARFLNDNGVACVVFEAERDVQLFATQPFADEREAAPLVKQVKELGKEYFKGGGGYDFAGCAAAKF